MFTTYSQSVFRSVFVFPSRVALRYIFTFLLMSFLVHFSCSFRRILPILVSSLTFLRVFLTRLTSFTSCFFWSLRLSFHPIFTQTPLSVNLNYNNFHYTEARNTCMRTSLSSAGVSWRALMGYPSYARNRACALPSPSLFQ